MSQIYVSCDELACSLAKRWGTIDIYEHPRQVPELNAGDWLVIDFDHILFDDRDAAVALLRDAVRRGVLVGVHSYSTDAPGMTAAVSLPEVVVAKRRRDVLTMLHRRSRELQAAA
jgi:hypothetical protein